MEKIEIISILLFVFIGAFLNSLLSYFLEYCFYEGSIFGGWLPLLAKMNLKLFKPEKYYSLRSTEKNPHRDNLLVQEASDLFFFKILGGCVICTNIWIGTITFIGLNLIFDISYFYIIPYLLFSSFCLRKIL